MSRNLPVLFRSTRLTLTLAVLLVAVGSVIAQSDVKEKPRAVAVANLVSQSDVKEKTRPILDVEGNKIFSKKELTDTANKYLDSWAEDGHKYNPQELDYCLHILTNLIRSRGYLQGKVDRGKVEETEDGSRVVLAVEEGPLYRVGELKIEEARLFSPAQIREVINLKTGDIANGEILSRAVFEVLKHRYASFGYIQYTADIQPKFHIKDEAPEGVVDLTITVDEGQQFTLRSIRFAGADKDSADSLRREFLIHNGDIFDDDLVRESVSTINRTGLFDTIDVDKDIDYRVTEKTTPLVDLTIHVKKKTVASLTN